MRQPPLASELGILAAATARPNGNLVAVASSTDIFVAQVLLGIRVPHDFALIVFTMNTGHG